MSSSVPAPSTPTPPVSPAQKPAVRPPALKIAFAVGLILFIFILAFFYFSRGPKNNQPETDDQTGQNLSFVISAEEMLGDFENIQLKVRSDLEPPQEIKGRYAPFISQSLKALESGVPSEEKFKDLRDDYFNLAVYYNILGDYDQARQYYLRLLEKWPDDYLARLNLGDVYISMGQYRATASVWHSLVQSFPHDFRIYEKIASFYTSYSLKNSDERNAKAEKIYLSALERADNPKNIYKEYADFLENSKGDYARALWARKEYEKISGFSQTEEIMRLEEIIGSQN